jgi:lipoprotein-releasing system permease protein
MFEFSVALKYLTPRWRQLSVSIISLISVLVIALVVWLIVVFFSVTNGLEKSWIQKLIALTAPVRITPTSAYYQSYFYLQDSIASKSNYTLKTIGEKLQSGGGDAYDPLSDEEPPRNWALPDRNADGQVKDLVGLAFKAVERIPGAKARDYEMTVSNIKLRLIRKISEERVSPIRRDPAQTQAFVSQAAYLGSLDPENPSLARSIIKTNMDDLNNALNMIAVASDNIQEDNPDSILTLDAHTVQDKLKQFFDSVNIQELKVSDGGWIIPRFMYPAQGSFQVCVISQGARLVRLIVPKQADSVPELTKDWTKQRFEGKPGTLTFKEGKPFLNDQELPSWVSIEIEKEVTMAAKLEETSLNKARNSGDLLFQVNFKIQGVSFQGVIPFRYLQIAKASLMPVSPFWFSQRDGNLVLPVDKEAGEGLLLPKTFHEAGVLLADRGYLSYYTPTTSAVQEQRIPIFVAGFYDPGIIPIGGKFMLANGNVTSLIRSSHNQEDTTLSNGINVRIPDISKASEVKKALELAFAKEGIAPYWKIETYKEFDFTKDLIQQLHSDKILFTLISTVIIIVACSNIISMLIILVNDKKLEIGILRSMGASSGSIAVIFGFCGVVMGVTGSLIGTCLAVLTLKNLDLLVQFLSSIQGHNAFNPVFYGETLPNEISYEALVFVVLATGGISLIAGIVPAVKACMLKPSSILRSE